MTIYDADCHTLKKDQKTDVKIDNYFLCKERSLFEIKVDFSGANKTTHVYGPDITDTRDTTVTYEFVFADVINNLRENRFPKTKPDGTYEIEKSDAFNPSGKYGKIKDSDLIRLKHNPCFACKFTAWVVLRRKINNLIIEVTEEDHYVTPTKPDDSWDQWSVISGPDIKYRPDPTSGNPWVYLVNASQRFTVQLSMAIHPGFIDPKTRNLGKVFTFQGWAIESEESPNAKIKAGDSEFNALAAVEEGVTARIEWKPNKKRPA